MRGWMTRIAILVMVLMLVLGLMISGSAEEGVVVIEPGATGEEYMELVPDESIRVKGDYIILFFSANWPSDDNLRNGYSQLYINSIESGAKVLRYNWPVDTHIPMYVFFRFTNLSMEKMVPLERVECRIVYDDQYEFTTMAVQLNPDQVSADGYCHYSTKGVQIESLIEVGMAVYASVPKIVRDTKKPLVAYITIDGTTTYMVQLRDVIKTME